MTGDLSTADRVVVPQTHDRLPSRLDSLTSLRFFAALAVVALHVGERDDPLSKLSKVAGLGYTGVSFFFVLSGFVLAWSYRSGVSVGRFYWRRFARIWPLHALTTFLAAAVALALGTAITWAALPAVLGLVQAWFPTASVRYGFNGPSWSLSCEAFFYLLFPLMLGPINRSRRPLRIAGWAGAAMVFVLAVGGAVLSTARLDWLTYSLPPYRLGEFVIGICLAAAIRQGWRPRWSLAQAAAAVIVCYVTVVGACDVVLHDPARLPYGVADLWMLPAFAALISSGATSDIRGTGEVLRHRWLLKLGEWSFALYLVQELLLKATERSVDKMTTGAAAVAAVGITIACVAASGLLHEAFEAPVERRLRRFARR